MLDMIDGRYRAMRFVSVLLLALPGLASAAQSLQVPLAPGAIPQFVDPLPRLNVQPGGTFSIAFIGTSPREAQAVTKRGRSHPE